MTAFRFSVLQEKVELVHKLNSNITGFASEWFDFISLLLQLQEQFYSGCEAWGQVVHNIHNLSLCKSLFIFVIGATSVLSAAVCMELWSVMWGSHVHVAPCWPSPYVFQRTHFMVFPFNSCTVWGRPAQGISHSQWQALTVIFPFLWNAGAFRHSLSSVGEETSLELISQVLNLLFYETGWSQCSKTHHYLIWSFTRPESLPSGRDAWLCHTILQHFFKKHLHCRKETASCYCGVCAWKMVLA